MRPLSLSPLLLLLLLLMLMLLLLMLLRRRGQNTVQMIVFLRYLKLLSSQDLASKRRLPHLVIVPSDLRARSQRGHVLRVPSTSEQALQWEIEESRRPEENSRRAPRGGQVLSEEEGD